MNMISKAPKDTESDKNLWSGTRCGWDEKIKNNQIHPLIGKRAETGKQGKGIV